MRRITQRTSFRPCTTLKLRSSNIRLVHTSPTIRRSAAPERRDVRHAATPSTSTFANPFDNNNTKHAAEQPGEEEGEDVDLSTLIIQDPGIYEIILPSQVGDGPGGASPPSYVFGTAHMLAQARSVPEHIRRPSYAIQPQHPSSASASSSTTWTLPYPPERFELEGDGRIRDVGEVEKLRKAARLAKKTLDFAGGLVKTGVTTNEIDAAVHKFVVDHDAYPSPLLYKGFPKSCCTSVNNVITHGIPDDRPLQEGDILNIDITVYLDGYHGDTSRTFTVGEVDHTAQSLISTTNACLTAAIHACGPGKPFRGIATAIHETLLSRRREVERQREQQQGGEEEGMGWCVSPQFTGHGIGRVFHRTPWILHDFMLPGHCFTIEPCIIQGSDSSSWTFPDGWTVSTTNGARSAQAEHMVLVSEEGVEVLTE